MATNTAQVSPPSRQDPRQVLNTLRELVNWNDVDVALVTFANSLPLGAFITDAFVEVVTAFDGTTPTMTVGTNASSYDDIGGAGQIDLTAIGVTRLTKGLGRAIAATADKPVFAKTTLTSATAGQAVIVVTFDGGWSS